MEEYGITVPQGEVASYAMAAKDTAEKLGKEGEEEGMERERESSLFPTGGGAVVVKAQVLAGGRGKGQFLNGQKGGVRIAQS